MRPSGLNHIAIKTPDPERLERFYREALGLEEMTRHHDDGRLRSIWLDLGGTILMLERTDASRAEEAQAGIHLIALTIDAKTRNAWRDRVPIEGETEYTLYTRDPDGNRIGLSSWPDQHNET